MSREHRQLSLFEEPSHPVRRGGRVAAAPVVEEHRHIAARLPSEVRLGTSSWSFPGWAGSVYDRTASAAALARHGLGAYARHPLLRAVGIDRTYYAPVPAETFAEYAAAVPEDFRFLVKAPALCTSPREVQPRSTRPNPLFLDPAFAVDQVVGPLREGLGEKAGPLVFQFAPLGPEHTRDPGRFLDRLGEFLGALPRGGWYAVELRDRELLVPAYREALAAAGTRHCFNVHPRMPSVAAQREALGDDAEGPMVARWMLHSGLGYEQAVRRYEPFSRLVDEDPVARSELVGLCLSHVLRGQPVVVVANNKAEGCAPLSVIALARELAERLGTSEESDP